MESLWGQRRGLEFSGESSASPVNTVTTWWSDGKLPSKEAGLTQRGSLYFTESRRDQEEEGELDSHEEVNPEEIKSREVVLGWRVGLFLLHLFPSGGATDIVFVTLFCIAFGTANQRWSLRNAGRTLP